jgi:hypothetical protein
MKRHTKPATKPPIIRTSKTRVKRTRPPRTVEEYAALSRHFKNSIQRATEAIAKMRKEGLSLRAASRESSVSPATVTRWAGSALKKTPGGRYQVKKSDQLLRVMKVPGPNGLVEVGIKGSKQASLLGEYSAAVDRYLKTGDSSRLDKFKDKEIKDATGKPIVLITDRKELNRLGGAGVLSFESIYARSK